MGHRPLFWLAYTLIKGPIVDKYPYPFLDPANRGYGTVAIDVIAIMVLTSIVAVAAVWLADSTRDRDTETASRS